MEIEVLPIDVSEAHMKKKKKSAAARNLIDSLLDEASKPGAPSSASTLNIVGVNPSSGTSSFGEAPFLQPKLESSLDTSLGHKIQSDHLGGKKSYSDDGQSPTLMLSLDDEKTSHLSVDAHASLLAPDPLARAEEGERTRLAIVRTQEAGQHGGLDETYENVVSEPAPFDLVAPPTPSQGHPYQHPPMDGAKPLTKPARLAPEFGEPGVERTVRLESPRASSARTENENGGDIDHGAATEIRSGMLKRPHISAASAGAMSGLATTAEAALKQSESLRIAQDRITALEEELERLRRENEQLATAGETLRRRSDELLAKSESIEASAREAQRIFEEEKKVLRGQMQGKDRESVELRQRLDEMENRLENNFKKIRVRERELEHRLEIVKMESATLVSTKDKMILDLKRQIDQLSHESEYAKQKTQELFNQYKDKQETVRRVVRALRIALTILEGDEEGGPSKKAE
jgi:hypothetical protein